MLTCELRKTPVFKESRSGFPREGSLTSSGGIALVVLAFIAPYHYPAQQCKVAVTAEFLENNHGK